MYQTKINQSITLLPMNWKHCYKHSFAKNNDIWPKILCVFKHIWVEICIFMPYKQKHDKLMFWTWSTRYHNATRIIAFRFRKFFSNVSIIFKELNHKHTCFFEIIFYVHTIQIFVKGKRHFSSFEILSIHHFMTNL